MANETQYRKVTELRPADDLRGENFFLVTQNGESKSLPLGVLFNYMVDNITARIMNEVDNDYLGKLEKASDSSKLDTIPASSYALKTYVDQKIADATGGLPSDTNLSWAIPQMWLAEPPRFGASEKLYPVPGMDGWVFCFGQVLNKSDYPDLYKVLGDSYNPEHKPIPVGNDYKFHLPDFRGRVPIGSMAQAGDDGSGIEPHVGQVGGNSSVTLTRQNLPAHSHTIDGDGNYEVWGVKKQGVDGINQHYGETGSAGGKMNAPLINHWVGITQTRDNSGTLISKPFSTLPPFVTVNYIMRLKPTI